MIHDTRSPLSCCPRCQKAELAGRARHRPVFRYNKVDTDSEATSCYQVFHGEHLIATLTRDRRERAVVYDVAVAWDGDAPELAAGNLRDARVLAEEAYIAVWREGRYAARGPVQIL